MKPPLIEIEAKTQTWLCSAYFCCDNTAKTNHLSRSNLFKKNKFIDTLVTFFFSAIVVVVANVSLH